MMLPINLLPTDLLPWGLLPGVGSGYLIYGPYLSADATIAGVAAGDGPAASAAAGSTSIEGLVQDPSTVRYWAITAVSIAGVESDPLIVRREVDAAGNAVGSAPNALVSASAVSAAGGDVRVEIVYVRDGEDDLAPATSIEVAEIAADGSIDWESPIATLSIGGGYVRSDLGATYDHGRTVRLAARAVTAAGVGGAPTRMGAVVIDAQGPDGVTALEVH